MTPVSNMWYKNVITDVGDEILFDKDGCSHFYQMCSYLHKYLPDFESYLFILYGHNGTRKPTSRNFVHPKKVLIVEGGENKMLDFEKIKDDYYAIFAHYIKPQKDVVNSIPLGPFGNQCTKSVEPSERMYDITFCGCLNSNRVSLASKITGIGIKWIAFGLTHAKKHTLQLLSVYSRMKHPGHFYHFNPDFNKGFDTQFFNYTLSHSKIALCPKGWVNAETFRLFEAMRLGCVVICENLPDRWYYKGIPAIQIGDWNTGYEEALRLLEQPEELQRLSKASMDFYNSKLSGIAAAKHIIKQLNK